VMPMPEHQPGRKGEIIRGQMELTEEAIAVQMLEFLHDEDIGGVSLPDAEVIVSGGRGLGAPENFAVIQDLADAMGGVVGASRGAVDAGWIGSDRQVGQTGQTVRPKIYVAVGISGAIQHLVGMQTSDVIVAIHLDPDAPIFKVATYGIVGDYTKVVPALARQFREKLPARSKKA
jgi:electron transfer flavoprotein alpha subunit